MSELVAVREPKEVSPKRLEQMRRVFALSLEGQTYEEIAAATGQSRASVGRLLNEYRELYRRGIENTHQIHLVSERLAQYEAVAREALAEAGRAKTDQARNSHRRTALLALKAFDDLCLRSGVYPTEPRKFFSVSAEWRPPEMEENYRPVEASPEEMLAEIDRLARFGRRIT